MYPSPCPGAAALQSSGPENAHREAKALGYHVGSDDALLLERFRRKHQGSFRTEQTHSSSSGKGRFSPFLDDTAESGVLLRPGAVSLALEA